MSNMLNCVLSNVAKQLPSLHLLKLEAESPVPLVPYV
jgi:hypothetical protein